MPFASLRCAMRAFGLTIATLSSRRYRIRWGLGPKVWRVLAKCHEIRNRGEYEGDLNVDDRLVKDLVIACKAVARAVGKLAPL